MSEVGVAQDGIPYDYVLAFPADSKDEETMERRRVVLAAIRDTGLYLTSSYSSRQKCCYILVGCYHSMLVELATTFWKTENADETAEPRQGYLRMFARAAKDESKAEPDVVPRGLCNLDLLKEHNWRFSSLQRIALIEKLLTAPLRCGGLDLDFRRLVRERVFSRIFPLHNEQERAHLSAVWGESQAWRNILPANVGELETKLDLIRDYLGEREAIYFAFLAYFTQWLVVPSLFGLILTLSLLATQAHESVLTPVFCIVISILATLFVEMWKRRNAVLAYRWDVHNLAHTEATRSEFEPTSIRRGFYTEKGKFVSLELEHVTFEENHGEAGLRGRSQSNLSKSQGGETKREKKETLEDFYVPYYPEWLRTVARVWSTVVTMIVLAAVMFVVFGLLALRIQIQSAVHSQYWGSVVHGFLLTFFVSLSNQGFDTIARRLTDQENHRTDTEYEDSLIRKTFSFQFINTFAALFYIAFVKRFGPTLFGKEDGCEENNCMMELSGTTTTFLITRLLLTQFIEFMWPVIFRYMKKWRYALLPALTSYRGGNTYTPLDEDDESKGVDDDRRSPNSPSASQSHAQQMIDAFGDLDSIISSPDFREETSQWIDTQYNQLDPEGPLLDYASLMLQLGFVTLFATAFPLASLCCLLSNCVNMHSDLSRRLKSERRLPYTSAKDIGSWLQMLTCMAFATVATNAGILALTSNQLLRWFAADDDVDQPSDDYAAAYYALLFAAVFEHVVFALKVWIDRTVPDIPLWLSRRIMKEQFFVQQKWASFPSTTRKHLTKRRMKRMLSSDI
eukprot:Rmarinus@m.13007